MTAPANDPATAAADARTAAMQAARAALPQSTSKPRQGTVTLGEGTGHLARWTARLALLAAAADIATAIGEATGDAGAARRVLLVEDLDLAGRDWPYGAVTAELARHHRSLAAQLAAVTRSIRALRADARVAEGDERLDVLLGGGLVLGVMNGQAPRTAVPLTEHLTATATSAADVIGLLRSDYTVASATHDTATGVLTAAVAERLRAAGIEVVVPGFHLVPADEGPVNEALDRTLDADLSLAAAQLQLQELLAARTGEDADPDAARGKERDLQTTAVRAAWATTLTALMTAPADGMPPLAAAAVQAALRNGGAGTTHVVHLSLDSSGTDVISRQSLFGPSGRLWLVGGITASWLMVGAAGPGLTKAGSHHQGWRTEYDLKTGASAGAVLAQPGTVATGTGKPFRPTSPAADLVPRLIAIGLAAAGGLWLVVDALTKLG